MNLFFPQVNAALVVRKHCPKGGRLVTTFADKGVYLIETDICPKGCRVADKILGGWNYPSGECVALVCAYSFTKMTMFCEREQAEKLVRTRRLEDGRFVNLVRTRTRVRMSIGCTPILAEAELAEDEAEAE